MMNENEKEFHELMTDYFQGVMSEQECKQLLSLINSDQEYKSRFLEMKSIQGKSYIPFFEKQKESNYQHLLDTLDIKPVKRVHRHWLATKQVAAIAVLCVISSLVSLYIYRTTDTTRQESYTCETIVPLGSQVQVYLPDSSIVHLNSGSVLRYNAAYNRNNREIYLNGEGYFTIKKGNDIPFIVKAGNLNVKVLGTIFNVKAYEEENKIEVGLIEGSVNVYTNNEHVNNRILAPNEHLVYNKLTQAIQISPIDAQRTYQWTKGVLYFHKASLVEICKALERKFNISISPNSKHMTEDYFTGSISSELTITEMIDFLDIEKKYKWEKSGNTIYICDK